MSNGMHHEHSQLVDHSAADHRCYECLQRGQIRALLAERDTWRKEESQLRDALAAVRRELAVSEFRRLTLEVMQAIERNDQKAWAALMNQREKCCVGVEEREAIEREYAGKEAA